MVQINLLPWRERLEIERKRQFIVQVIGYLGLTLLLVCFVDFVLAEQLHQQQIINNILGDELRKLDAQITEIKGLQEQKRQLIDHMNIVQELQGKRSQVVHIFDELVRVVPDGIYLNSVKWQGTLLTLTGKAQSNIEISHLMRNIESSNWLGQPSLSEIKTDAKPDTYDNDFTLQLNINPINNNKAKVRNL